MDNENKYAVEFSIISYAGNARALADEAVTFAKSGNFESAQKNIEEAQASLTQAHQAQTDLIFKAINGENVNISIFLIHAQDHLTMATLAIDTANKFIDLYKEIKNK